MTQPADETSIGYALKRVQAALHSAMEDALREFGLGVSQYACLTVIAHRPGISNADLARAVFVSRQATHQLLAGLVASELVVVSGRGRGARLEPGVRALALLAVAERRVAEVQERMLAPLSPTRRAALLDDLTLCAEALDG